MKKLMFAAVAAAMAGVASAECSLPDAPTPVCVYPVWDFQMVLVADSHCQCYGATQGAIVDPCGLDQEASTICVNWRVPETRIYTGQIFTCDCECITGTGVAAEGLNLAMYDAIRGKRYYDASNGQEFDKPELKFSKLYRWGVRGELVAGCASLKFKTEGEDADLTLAGHGVFPWTAGSTSSFLSMSGYVAGTLGDAMSCDSKTEGKTYCNYYFLCADTTTDDLLQLMSKVANGDMGTACAYGQFVIQYNSVLTDRFAMYAGDLSAILPSWFLNGATKK